MTDAILILAASDRLARCLREDHALAQRNAGRQVWRTPRILSLDQWVTDVWTTSWPAEQLLSTTQALTLWLDTIRNDASQSLLVPLATAREALKAERLALLWNLDLDTLPAWNAELRAWKHWRQDVRGRMQRHGWLLREDLYARVCTAVQDSSVAVPETVELHGFDAAEPPAIQRLLEALTARTQVETVGLAAPPKQDIQRLHVADFAQQWRHVAITVRTQLHAAGERSLRITIAVPELETHRPALEAALSAWVAPLAGSMQRRPPWRWDAGRPASTLPWIDAASAVLALDAHGMDGPTASHFLLAAPLWPAPLSIAAAALDYRLRDEGHPVIALRDLCSNALGALKIRLQQLADAVEAEPRTALPSAWAECFSVRLAALEWPVEGTLSSIPFQCVNELRKRLGRLAGLDAMLGAVDIATARRWLNELLRAGFEPRVEYPQAVSIMAPEHAARLPCDLLIVCGAASSAFPGRAQPTPFLDLETQRRAGIPDAAATTWMNHARKQVAALLQQAPQVQILCPRLDDSGAEIAPAPLFAGDWQDATAFPPLGVAEALAAAATPLLLPDQDPVPPVSSIEQVRGDSRLFEEWAKSPFMAFCTHRLGVEPLPLHARGLSARDQGILIHGALDTVWGKLRTRAGLEALTEVELDAKIAAALAPQAEHVLRKYAFSLALRTLETARITDLLKQWLRHERRRADAFEVIRRELRLETRFGGLPMVLRIDRIDRVDTADGPRTLLLDYKTGREAKPGGWQEDSLKAPQLPLYAVVAPGLDPDITRVAGIGFAHLKDGHPALSVACDWSTSLLEDGTTPKFDWDARLQSWAATLELRARNFMDGIAGFDASSWKDNRYDDWVPLLAGQTGPADEDAEDSGDAA
ncbi:MAG: hypothetical protein EPN72_03835 [Nevskiaceae bacterium]|nr:MAG: hypothetical protein EPN63_06615 [Nevskiaceae bacterium]TBR73953.1 MAG: hypothetical protein EPN72_03835 [Nevskiaceae bacterium]